MRAAAFDQFMEHAVQIERLRRGIHCRSYFSRQAIFNSPHQQRGLAGGSQNGVDQESAGGFPVGSRYARQVEPAIWLAVEIAGCRSQRAASMLHFDPRSFEPRWSGKLAGHGYRAPIHGGLGELAAVGTQSWKSEKQKACLHSTRVILQSTNLDSAQIPRKLAPVLKPAEDLFKRHSASAAKLHAHALSQRQDGACLGNLRLSDSAPLEFHWNAQRGRFFNHVPQCLAPKVRHAARSP